MTLKHWMIGLGAAGVFALAACSQQFGSTYEDNTLYLTGTEEEPIEVQQPDGSVEKVCPTDKKALICHIPPGNPANAHTICVGKAAVKAHTSHHGDGEGECAVADAGTEGTGTEGEGTPGEGETGGDAGTEDPTAGVN